MTNTRVRLDHLDANPFRHIERYPIREEKIAALQESIFETGFWDNLVGRKAGDRVQIAYGHHRREALLRSFDPDHEVSVVVRDFDDEHMLKIMARENMEEWGSSVIVEHETIRAVVEAYAEGRIELAQPGPMARDIRYAPSFVPDPDRGQHPYTAQSVAEFLGWVEPSGRPQQKVSDALAALAFIEEGTLSEADFVGLSTAQARAVVEDARRARAMQDANAKAAQQKAEERAKAAEKAKQAAAKAEITQREASQRAQQAKDDAARRREQEKAEEARREAARQRKEEREAQRQFEEQRKRQESETKQGQENARTAGSETSAHFKSGGGLKDRPKQGPIEQEPDPVHIDVYARKIAGQLFKLMDPQYHKLAQQLDEMVKFRSHISPEVALNLSRELTSLGARVEEYRTRLGREQETTSTAGPDLGILDAEIVHDDTIKEITR